MGIGISIFLVAVGAMLAFAVETNPSDVNLNAAGAILMVVGLLGLLLSLLLWEDWRPWGRRRTVDDDVIVRRRDVLLEDEPVVRRHVIEEEPATARRPYR